MVLLMLGLADFGSPGQFAGAAESLRSKDLLSWVGTYGYSSPAGKTAGGTGIVVDYRLAISPKTPEQAVLSIRGYQVNEALRCRIKGSQDEIAVTFVSFANGKTANEYGVEEYKPGAVLFTLAREGNRQKLVTTWKALKPDTAKSQSGVYFIKQTKRGSGSK